MRPSCLNCCRKHLAQAEVLMLEARKGYPVHGWLAVGHMAEAEDETLQLYPEITEEIRKHRLEYMNSLNRDPQEYFSHLYNFPSLDLIEIVTDKQIEVAKVASSQLPVTKDSAVTQIVDLKQL